MKPQTLNNSGLILADTLSKFVVEMQSRGAIKVCKKCSRRHGTREPCIVRKVR